MRSIGTLRSWNDERGFGFIAPTQGGAELFVHVSAFPRDGSRPVAGETLSFELGRGKDGKPQAVNVVRSAIGAGMSRTAAPRPASRGMGRFGRGLVLCLVIAVSVWGYGRHQEGARRRQPESQPAAAFPEAPPAAAPGPSFQCDGRTRCAQMTSCAEATWFINHCPGTQMDGNHDGVPCEQQWCTGAGTR